MKLTIPPATRSPPALAALSRIVERRNTIPIPLQHPARGEGRDADAARDGSRHRGPHHPALHGAGRRRAHPAGADAHRHRRQAAGRRRHHAGDGRREGRPAQRTLALPDAHAARERLPRHHGGRILAPLRDAGGDAGRDDRQHAVRDLDRGDALLSQRASTCTPPPTARPRCCARSPPTGIASPGCRCRRPRARRTCRASSCRARRSARSRVWRRMPRAMSRSRYRRPRSA